MSKEYIDKSAFLKIVNDYLEIPHLNIDYDAGVQKFKKMLEVYPTADVEPVRHGRWIIETPGRLTCSYCDKSMYIGGKDEIDTLTETIEIAKSNVFFFCPICGTQMDLEIVQKLDDYIKQSQMKKIKDLKDFYTSIHSIYNR